MQLAVAAAIAAGGVDGDDDEAPTLTVVDDCFFVTHHSVQRAVRSGDAKLAVVPLLHEIVDALRNLVYPKIMGTLRGAGAAAAANREWIVAFNAIDHAAAYASQLRDRVGAAFCGEFELAQMADPALEEFANISIHLRQQGAELAAALAATLLPTAWLLLEFGPAEYEIGSEAHEAAIQQSFDEKLWRRSTTRSGRRADPARGERRPRRRRARRAGGAARGGVPPEVVQRARRAPAVGAGAQAVRRALVAVERVGAHQFGRLTHLAFVLNVGSLQEAAALLMSTMGAAVKVVRWRRHGCRAPRRCACWDCGGVQRRRAAEMMPDLAEEEAEEGEAGGEGAAVVGGARAPGRRLAKLV